MRILFSTQGQSLDMFHALARELASRKVMASAGFVVADSKFYAQWFRKHPAFEHEFPAHLKEWEVMQNLPKPPDRAKIRAYEVLLDSPAGLFGAIVTDRRILMGPDATYAQDYRRRFTDDQLLSILQAGCESIERLFEKFQPTHIAGFICVTFIDYLVYLFAQAKGLPYYNLRPTRIQDKVAFYSTINDPSPEFVSEYQSLLQKPNSATSAQAKNYIDQARAEHVKYEGVIATSDKPAIAIKLAQRNIAKKIGDFGAQCQAYYTGLAQTDNHVPDPVRAIVHHALLNPLRAQLTHQTLQKGYITQESLKTIHYVFFPLHTEPEISLLVYSRPLMNQVELIRMIALSLPADTYLVVKEHPWMVGKRRLSAYRKILNIPKVCLVNPKMLARNVITHASAVAVITGSIALEAAIMKKPVLTFGDCPFNVLPETMVTRVRDIRKLNQIIAQAINEYCYDDSALAAFVAASISLGASISLYSVLLCRQGVYAVSQEKDFYQEIKKLADYFTLCITRSDKTCNNIGDLGGADW